MLKALLKWFGFDLEAKPLTVDEDRSGILNFGVPTEEDRRLLEAIVAARRKHSKHP